MQSRAGFPEEVMAGAEFARDSGSELAQGVGSRLEVTRNLEEDLFVGCGFETETERHRGGEEKVHQAFHRGQSEACELLALRGAGSGDSLPLWCGREREWLG